MGKDTDISSWMFSFTLLMYSTCSSLLQVALILNTNWLEWWWNNIQVTTTQQQKFSSTHLIKKSYASHKSWFMCLLYTVMQCKCFYWNGSYTDLADRFTVCETVSFCSPSKQTFASPFDYAAHLPPSCSQKSPMFAAELCLGLHLCCNEVPTILDHEWMAVTLCYI